MLYQKRRGGRGRNTCKSHPWKSFSRDVNEFIFSEQPLLMHNHMLEQSSHVYFNMKNHYLFLKIDLAEL